MNLADHIIEAAGTDLDMAGSLTSIAATIKRAERFEMSDDVVRACASLVDSKPSTLHAALPICRLPYENMWIEYRGGVNAHENTRGPTAPVPVRQGFLIEAEPDHSSGRVGYATVAWVHKNLQNDMIDAPFMSPFAIYFDWREEGDVREIIRLAHQTYLEIFPQDAMEKAALKAIIGWMERIFLGASKSDEIRRFFMVRSGWQRFVRDEKEIEAIRQSENHILCGLSPHGIRLLLQMTAATFANNDAKGAHTILNSWLADIQGEGCFMECFLAMLNSRNCIEREPVDFSRLNKARQKRGKRPLLDYTKTKIVLSRTQASTAHARGMDREAARLHLVRGHFKIRRTGVYWWCSFTRGDPLRPVKRKEYEVT